MADKNYEIVVNERASAILYDYFLFNAKKKMLFPANICPIVILAALKAGIEFDFVDISLDTYCMDLNGIEVRSLNDNVVIFFVFSYGLGEEQILLLEKLHREYKVKIVLDKCLCFPQFEAFPDFAELILFSTYQSKPVTLKYGGFAFVQSNYAKEFNIQKLPYSKEAANKVDEYLKVTSLNLSDLKELSRTNWLPYHHGIPALEHLNNYKFKVLEKMKSVYERKKENHLCYKENISRKGVEIKNNFDWRTIVIFESKLERDSVLANIFDEGYFASHHYKDISYIKKIYSKNARTIESTVLNLFNDDIISNEDIKVISKIINES